MPRPKLRTPELREQLLDAALETLAEAGIAGFTSRRIASNAATSVPAIYELFGDRAGLVRAVFFAGFQRLGETLAGLPQTDSPRRDLEAMILSLRAFSHEQPTLTQVMFSQPFVDFEPGPEEAAAGALVRETIVGHVSRCVDAAELVGDPQDVAHVVLAISQGLMTQEWGGWLGAPTAADRRWALAIRAVLDGLAPPRSD